MESENVKICSWLQFKCLGKSGQDAESVTDVGWKLLMHGKEGLVERLMVRVVRSDLVHFHHGRIGALIFFKIYCCCIKSKLLGDENDLKMRIWIRLRGWERRNQSRSIDGSHVGRKNRATPEHDFSEKLENFQHWRNDNILNIWIQRDSIIKTLKTIGSKIKSGCWWILMVHCWRSKNRDGFKSRNSITTLLDALAHATLKMATFRLVGLMGRLKTSILDKIGLIEIAWAFTSVNIASGCLFEMSDLEFGSTLYRATNSRQSRVRGINWKRPFDGREGRESFYARQQRGCVVMHWRVGEGKRRQMGWCGRSRVGWSGMLFSCSSYSIAANQKAQDVALVCDSENHLSKNTLKRPKED